MKGYPLLLPLLILAFCLFNAREIFNAWFYSPKESLTWLAFLLWATPLFYRFPQLETNPYLLGCALLLTFLGLLASFNTLHYFALAFALASFLPWRIAELLWIPAAVAWMPAGGWLASHLFPQWAVLLKITLAFLAGALMTFSLINHRRSP